MTTLKSHPLGSEAKVLAFTGAWKGSEPPLAAAAMNQEPGEFAGPVLVYSESYRVLASMEFHGAIDAWTEYLCLETHPDGSITLTSRSQEVLAYIPLLKLEYDENDEPIYPTSSTASA